MASRALGDLLTGIEEVRALRANSRPRRTVRRRDEHSWVAAQIANRRACVVLMCSHYERYIYGLNEEATDFLNSLGLASERLPERVRLLQSKGMVEDLSLQQWDMRSRKLEEFATSHAPMWTPGAKVVVLAAGPMLASMKSPKVRDVQRYFESFGVPRIFDQITRSEQTRRHLTRSLQALVDSRNGIAHGDATVQPLSSDLTEYIRGVITFASRADRVFARRLGTMGGAVDPW